MCGSGSYDRDDYYSSRSNSSSYYDSSSGFDYSAAARQALSAQPTTPRVSAASSSQSESKRPEPLKPRSNVNSSPQQRISCTTKNGVVLVLDATSSIADAALLFYDKLPLLYSELIDQKYLSDFSVSFSAVGDVTSDPNPVQVTEFCQGKKLDESLIALKLDRGGGQIELCESYEFLAYYYANLVTLSSDMQRKPFLFFLGDERPRERLEGAQLTRIFGGTHQNVRSEEVFQKLAEKYDAYVLCTPYRGGGFDAQDTDTRTEWERFLPGHVLHVKEPKSVVDIILGVIAIQTGCRTIKTYLSDLKKRKQTDVRVGNVREALTSVFS